MITKTLNFDKQNKKQALSPTTNDQIQRFNNKMRPDYQVEMSKIKPYSSEYLYIKYKHRFHSPPPPPISYCHENSH